MFPVILFRKYIFRDSGMRQGYVEAEGEFLIRSLSLVDQPSQLCQSWGRRKATRTLFLCLVPSKKDLDCSIFPRIYLSRQRTTSDCSCPTAGVDLLQLGIFQRLTTPVSFGTYWEADTRAQQHLYELLRPPCPIPSLLFLFIVILFHNISFATPE